MSDERRPPTSTAPPPRHNGTGPVDRRRQPSNALRRWRMCRPPLSPAQIDRKKMFEQYFGDLDVLIGQNTKFSREQSLASSCLQVAQFWVLKAIEMEGFEGEIPTPPHDGAAPS